MLDGMAEAGEVLDNVDYLDILVSNSYLDLHALAGKGAKSSKQGCSSLIKGIYQIITDCCAN
ncbi:MAG: hypothetical protein HY738_14110 [Bacteroidia bacterium]|nr:hypothetical protein [Bacteroidia bacterium]